MVVIKFINFSKINYFNSYLLDYNLNNNKSKLLHSFMFGYMGPVLGVVAWNTIGSLLAIICVYIFLHREKLKRYKLLVFLTKPFHNIIKKVANKRLLKK